MSEFPFYYQTSSTTMMPSSYPSSLYDHQRALEIQQLQLHQHQQALLQFPRQPLHPEVDQFVGPSWGTTASAASSSLSTATTSGGWWAQEAVATSAAAPTTSTAPTAKRRRIDPQQQPQQPQLYGNDSGHIVGDGQQLVGNLPLLYVPFPQLLGNITSCPPAAAAADGELDLERELDMLLHHGETSSPASSYLPPSPFFNLGSPHSSFIATTTTGGLPPADLSSSSSSSSFTLSSSCPSPVLSSFASLPSSPTTTTTSTLPAATSLPTTTVATSSNESGVCSATLPQTAAAEILPVQATVTLAHKPRGSQGTWSELRADQRIRVTKGRGKRLRLEIKSDRRFDWPDVRLQLVDVAGEAPLSRVENACIDFFVRNDRSTMRDDEDGGSTAIIELLVSRVRAKLQFEVVVDTRPRCGATEGWVWQGRCVPFTTHNNGKDRPPRRKRSAAAVSSSEQQ